MPMDARVSSSGHSDGCAAAVGVRMVNRLHTTTPPPSTSLGEKRDAMYPPARKKMSYMYMDGSWSALQIPKPWPDTNRNKKCGYRHTHDIRRRELCHARLW